MSRIDFHRPARVACPQLPTNPVVLAAPPQPVGRDGGASWLYLPLPRLIPFFAKSENAVADRGSDIFHDLSPKCSLMRVPAAAGSTQRSAG